jgi:hypothetical protein
MDRLEAQEGEEKAAQAFCSGLMRAVRARPG